MNSNSLIFVMFVVASGVSGLILFIVLGRLLLHFLKSPAQTRFPVTDKLKIIENGFEANFPVPNEAGMNVSSPPTVSSYSSFSGKG